jgi:FMN reductase
MNPLRLVVVTAGLSQPSSTRLLADRLAEATRHELAGHGREVELHVVELRDLAVDIAHNLLTGFPAGKLREAVDLVTDADGLIAVTPIFSASYSGLFKSFFDVLDQQALNGKPVLAAATGGTARHSLALEHALRPLFAYLHAVVVPTAVFAASEDWGSGATVGSEELAHRIDRAAAELATLLAPRPGTERSGQQDAEAELIPFAQQLAALQPR